MGKIFSGGILGLPHGDGGSGGDGGVPEAPIDGVLYGRQDANWTPIVDVTGIPEAPVDDQQYLRGGSTWQALAASLAALSPLAPAADKLPYFTGADTAGLAALTAVARNLLACVDAATMRQTLEVPDIIAGQIIFGGSGAGIFHAYPDETSTLGSYEFSFTAPGDLTTRIFVITPFDLIETYYTTFTVTRSGEPVYDAASDLTTVRVLLRRHDNTMDHQSWASPYVGFDWIAIKPAAGLARIPNRVIATQE